MLGIADIMRGNSQVGVGQQTQELKHQWGSIRLQRMQREVQRYIRDIIRIMAEIIAEKFQPETLQSMTQISLPSDAEVMQKAQQIMAQYQQQAMMAQQQGKQPPPQPQIPPKPITIEDVMKVLRDDASRSYKIGVETDSTIAASKQQDMAGLSQVLDGITQFIERVGPMVQQGVLPFEAAKEIVMTICRRADMGSAVEDALDKMQQPPAPKQEDPNAAEIQKAQIKAQSDQQIAQMKAQLEAQTQHTIEQARAQANQISEQARAQASTEVEQARLAFKAQSEEMERNHAAQLAAIKQQSEQQTAIIIAKINAMAKVQAAEVTKNTQLTPEQVNASGDGVDGYMDGQGGI
jgi:hypothetical protein